MIYFTSDFHFCHNRDFIYERRGFSSIEEHDKTIIDNFNSIVTDEDILYILGDVFLDDNEKGMECLQSLKGEKHVILGNHDTNAKIELLKQATIIEGYANVFEYKKYHFYLSHYPSITSNYDDGDHLRQRVINLSGHTHFKDKFYDDNPYVYNVAVDAHECKPVSIEEILQDIRQKRDSLKSA